MANSDIINTLSGSFANLSEKEKKVIMAGMMMASSSTVGGANPTVAQMKTYVQNAQTALQGVPSNNLPMIRTALWNQLLIVAPGSGTLAEATASASLKLTALAYLTSLDEDTLDRVIVFMEGINLTILT